MRPCLHRLAIVAVIAAGLAPLGGCAFGELRLNDPLDREISLEDAQHRYTVLVRWSDFERASRYVDPSMRAEFKAMLPGFRTLRFTEYESDPVEIDAELQEATVEVTYYAYSPSSPIEVEIHETQRWYRDPGVGNNWHVKPTFEGIEELLADGSR